MMRAYDTLPHGVHRERVCRRSAGGTGHSAFCRTTLPYCWSIEFPGQACGRTSVPPMAHSSFSATGELTQTDTCTKWVEQARWHNLAMHVRRSWYSLKTDQLSLLALRLVCKCNSCKNVHKSLKGFDPNTFFFVQVPGIWGDVQLSVDQLSDRLDIATSSSMDAVRASLPLCRCAASSQPLCLAVRDILSPRQKLTILKSQCTPWYLIVYSEQTFWPSI